MPKNHEAVIAEILIEIDAEQAAYQKNYRKLYGKADFQASQTYSLLKALCERIRKELSK